MCIDITNCLQCTRIPRSSWEWMYICNSHVVRGIPDRRKPCKKFFPLLCVDKWLPATCGWLCRRVLYMHSGCQPLNTTMFCCHWYNGCTSQKWLPLGLTVEPAIAIKWIPVQRSDTILFYLYPESCVPRSIWNLPQVGSAWPCKTRVTYQYRGVCIRLLPEITYYTGSQVCFPYQTVQNLTCACAHLMARVWNPATRCIPV